MYLHYVDITDMIIYHQLHKTEKMHGKALKPFDLTHQHSMPKQ